MSSFFNAESQSLLRQASFAKATAAKGRGDFFTGDKEERSRGFVVFTEGAKFGKDGVVCFAK